MGNPFLDDFPELVKLDNRNCADESVVCALRVLEDTGIQQYQNFVKNVLENCTQSIHDPIKKNSLALFKQPQPKVKSKAGKKIKVLQNNVALFGQLYISMQNRDNDLKEFFAHEIQSFPPSLSDFGKLHLPNTKSDILKCLDQDEQPEQPPSLCGCIVLDGAVIVHLLPTVEAGNFNEYADKNFIPYLSKQLERSTRIDIVWDTYQSDSLKESTRENRGKGVRRKVSGRAKLPSNWVDFFCDPNNKSELFALLTSKVASFDFSPNKAVYVTSGQSVNSTMSTEMMSCNHEEADTRIIVHVLHALCQGMKSKVGAVDTDVVFILTGAFFELSQAQPLVDIWVAFSMGKNYRFYSINTIYSRLGEQKSRALPVFHALTGCDTTSSFKGKGKKSAWQAWQAYEGATETLQHLASQPFQHLDPDSDHFKKIERLIVVMYDRTSPLTSVNEMREDLFCRRS